MAGQRVPQPFLDSKICLSSTPFLTYSWFHLLAGGGGHGGTDGLWRIHIQSFIVGTGCDLEIMSAFIYMDAKKEE